MILENVTRIKAEIVSICTSLGRNPEEVTLVGVTKYATVAAINEAIAAGISHVAENKVQEALKKYPEITSPSLTLPTGGREYNYDSSPRSGGGKGGGITKHMIGHLQTNKVKAALEIFDVIQSVDSLKLSQAIEKEAAKLNRPANILVEVNTSDEEQKYGVSPKEALTLVEQISELRHIRVLGLMTIGPATEDTKAIRGCFQKLKELYAQAAEKFQGNKNIHMKYLSMGMSSDYAIALEEGSNMVRIGSAIFGKSQ